MVGQRRHADNNWAFDYLPKLDKPYDMLQVFELMHQGKMNGYIAQGFNPLNSPNKAKVSAALAKLKFLVIMDPLATETSEFWQNHGEFNDVDPAKIQTDGVPPADHLLRRGRRRHRQLRPLAAVALEGRRAAGRGQDRPRSWPACSCACARCTRRTAAPSRPHPQPQLGLQDPDEPSPEELAKEYNGKALADQFDPRTRPRSSRRGELLDGFAQLATTAAPPAAAGSSPARGPRRAT
jgi:formate dehydrogenase major subunit